MRGKVLGIVGQAVTHEIVRAHKKVFKGRLKHLQNHVVWSQSLKCSVNAYVNQMLFQWTLLCKSLHMMK